MTPREILMKRKLIILLLVGLIAWLGYSPTPPIRFVEFRDSQSIPTGSAIPRVGRVAVFRITNDSRHHYSFFANAPSWPFGIVKIADPSDKSDWIESRDGPRSSISWFFYRLRLRIDPDYYAEPTWSTVASAR